MSWLDQIREVITRFQGFTHILSRLSQIVLFILISKFDNEGQKKLNLYTFDLHV